jgi:hypothetical protein
MPVRVRGGNGFKRLFLSTVLMKHRVMKVAGSLATVFRQTSSAYSVAAMQHNDPQEREERHTNTYIHIAVEGP